MRRASNTGRDNPTIGVVYLAWHKLGPDCFQRFVDSYRRYPAGSEHDLIVIYAGFNQQQTLQEAASVFRDLPHIAIEVAAVKFDIGYYLEAADRVPHDYLCFLNTYTELNAPSWLAHLRTHAVRDGVGLVGATGSYESLNDFSASIRKLVGCAPHPATRSAKLPRTILVSISKMPVPSPLWSLQPRFHRAGSTGGSPRPLGSRSNGSKRLAFGRCGKR